MSKYFYHRYRPLPPPTWLRSSRDRREIDQSFFSRDFSGTHRRTELHKSSTASSWARRYFQYCVTQRNARTPCSTFSPARAKRSRGCYNFACCCRSANRPLKFALLAHLSRETRPYLPARVQSSEPGRPDPHDFQHPSSSSRATAYLSTDVPLPDKLPVLLLDVRISDGVASDSRRFVRSRVENRRQMALATQQNPAPDVPIFWSMSRRERTSEPPLLRTAWIFWIFTRTRTSPFSHDTISFGHGAPHPPKVRVVNYWRLTLVHFLHATMTTRGNRPSATRRLASTAPRVVRTPEEKPAGGTCAIWGWHVGNLVV